MDSKSKTLSENLPFGGGSLCDCEGGLPKVGGGLPTNGGGLAFSLARGKHKYEGWIQREVDGVGDLSELTMTSRNMVKKIMVTTSLNLVLRMN